MDRRGFLGAILAAGVAPAFVGSSVLMPIRKLFIPRGPFVTIDDGEIVHTFMSDGTFLVTRPIVKMTYSVSVGDDGYISTSGIQTYSIKVGGGGGSGLAPIRPERVLTGG